MTQNPAQPERTPAPPSTPSSGEQPTPGGSSGGAASGGAASGGPKLEISTSRQFCAWLLEQNISLAVSTYQAGKLFFFGLQPDARLSVFERTFPRCMGLTGDAQTLWMSSLYQLWRFENVLEPGQATPDGYDRLYVPMHAHTTGDIDIHDMGIDADGRLVFCNTLFGCLATPSDTHSFTPLWKPPWISRLAAEDRCHLNGLGMRDGKPRYVTAVSQSDINDGWREHRRDGGLVYDLEAGEVIATGLSMAHSPRWHNGQLYLLESGSGYFGKIDLGTGKFERITFCPGYARGMSLHGQFALVGLSHCRENRTFTGLELDENLEKHQASSRCGIHVIDLRTGDTAHWLRIEGVVQELYDVAVLPGVRRPSAIGFKTDEIRRILRMDEWGKL